MDSIKLFKKLGYVEATSLLLLLFVAMPVKYIGGIPEAVSLVGMIHGVIFVVYFIFGTYLLEELKWSYGKLILACIVASIPFGPFIFERQLFRDN